jgi:Complex I intermediate-associated protein 30 (CIA30)
LLRFPLTPGAIELADVSKFRGISFDTRGDGNYRIRLNTYAVRRGEDFNAPFGASNEWKTQHINFAALSRKAETPVTWTGHDVRDIAFELAGPSQSSQWLEIDNLHFY